MPNLLTTANLFCGFFSIIKSLEGQFEFASWLIILATFFDFMDGRVARMTGSQSDFGVEFDSLSDLTTFCVAPAILSYTWGLFHFGKFGVAACFLFCACGALRLARFNVQSEGVEKFNFQGLPTPAGGGNIACFVIFFQNYFETFELKNYFLLFLTIALGLLMVSSVKYRSFKKVKRTSFIFMVCMIACIFIVAAEPEIMFFVMAITYVLTGMIEWVWKSPQKIRSLKDLLQHFYYERREKFIYEDDDDGDGDGDGDEDDDVCVTTSKLLKNKHLGAEENEE